MTQPRMTFSAVCFGPGLPPGGQRVSARAAGSALEIDLGGERLERIAWFKLQIAAGGFDHQQLLLSWSQGEEQWSLMPTDAAACAALIDSAPPEMQVRLAVWSSRVQRLRRRFHRGRAALAAIVAGPLLLLLVFWWQSERIVGWVVERIPPAVESQLGQSTLDRIAAQTPLLNDGPALAMVRDIGERLTRGSRYQYKWYIARDPQVNAYALPGGYVVVNSGLLTAADDAEEVAGVLAHEVQHVERRHSLKTMAQQLGWSALLALVTGDISSEWLQLAQQLGGLKFSRDHESEADRLGLQALLAAGIDAGGMLRFFRKLQSLDGASISLLSTHPATADRLAALEALLAQQHGPRPEPLSYPWPVTLE